MTKIENILRDRRLRWPSHVNIDQRIQQASSTVGRPGRPRTNVTGTVKKDQRKLALTWDSGRRQIRVVPECGPMHSH